jgi:hypothetical protein
MVVLIALGLAALTTSLAAMRLGSKSGDWHEAFYMLDGEAEADLARIDGLIKEADAKAKEYLLNKQEIEMSENMKSVLAGENDETMIYKLVFWDRLGALIDASDIEITVNGPALAVVKQQSHDHIPVIKFHRSGKGRIEAALEVYGQENDSRYKVVEWIYISR